MSVAPPRLQGMRNGAGKGAARSYDPQLLLQQLFHARAAARMRRHTQRALQQPLLGPNARSVHNRGVGAAGSGVVHGHPNVRHCYAPQLFSLQAVTG
jgi:hypothetical protein